MTQTLNEIFDFEIHKDVVDNLAFLDEILVELGVEPALRNKDFEVNKSGAGTNGVDFAVVSNENRCSIEMWILIETWGIRLDIDGIPETFEWTNKQITDSRKSVSDFIKHIFTGYISINARRSSRFIQIFDSNGVFVHQQSRNSLFHILTGIYLERNGNQRRLFLPFLTKS